MVSICAHRLNIHQRIGCTRHALRSVQTQRHRPSIFCRLQSTTQSHNRHTRSFPSWAADQARRFGRFRHWPHTFLSGMTCTKTGHRLASAQRHTGSKTLLGQHIQACTEYTLPETHLAPRRCRIVRTCHLHPQSRRGMRYKSRPMTMCLMCILCSRSSMVSAWFQLRRLRMLRSDLPFPVGTARIVCRRSSVPRRRHTVHRHQRYQRVQLDRAHRLTDRCSAQFPVCRSCR